MSTDDPITYVCGCELCERYRGVLPPVVSTDPDAVQAALDHLAEVYPQPTDAETATAAAAMREAPSDPVVCPHCKSRAMHRGLCLACNRGERVFPEPDPARPLLPDQCTRPECVADQETLAKVRAIVAEWQPLSDDGTVFRLLVTLDHVVNQ